jgi:hypothetical protein
MALRTVLFQVKCGIFAFVPSLSLWRCQVILKAVFLSPEDDVVPRPRFVVASRYMRNDECGWKISWTPRVEFGPAFV